MIETADITLKAPLNICQRRRALELKALVNESRAFNDPTALSSPFIDYFALRALVYYPSCARPSLTFVRANIFVLLS